MSDVEYGYGDKQWFFNGQRHRLDGPAVECADGTKHWWFKGEKIECSTHKEFEQLVYAKNAKSA